MTTMAPEQVDGAATARAYIYAWDEEPFVIPEGATQADLDEMRRVALHYASFHENAPWIAGGDVDRVDDILATIRAAERLRSRTHA